MPTLPHNTLLTFPQSSIDPQFSLLSRSLKPSPNSPIPPNLHRLPMCPATLFSSHLSHAPHLFDKMPHPRKAHPSPLKISCSSRQVPQDLQFISEPEPPWLVDPPVVLKNPFSDQSPGSDFRVNGTGCGIPLSLRIVQLRKKTKNSLRTERGECDRGSVGNAVWSLASVMGEFHRTKWVLDGGSDGCRNDVSEDAGDSIVWLFQKVFCSSPEIAVGILGLMNMFLAEAIVPVLQNALGNLLDSELVASPSFIPKCWSDIGVRDENEETRMPPEFQDYKRRRTAYEQLIVAGATDSMILSNYAQLLYQYDSDFERAHDYFKLAVMAEPADAEVRSRYALFLWHGLGDLEASEEMFLEAIQAEPENHYYRSSYACFLWKTGGTETCYPLPFADEDNVV